jgi:hypothetical protein
MLILTNYFIPTETFIQLTIFFNQYSILNGIFKPHIRQSVK